MLKQLVQPNLTVTGQLGWCLQYADKVFGAAAVFPTAWDAWMQTDFPHADRNIPQDVAVPLWFDYWESGIRYGHVVVSVPGQGLYSSPWDRQVGYNVLSSIESVEQHYGVSYVGWSEDISEVRVAIIGKGDEMTQSEAEKSVTYLYRLGTGDYPSPGQAGYWVSRVKDVPTGLDELGGEMLKAREANKPGEAEKKLQAIKDALK